jgi:acyl dehydratase
MAELEPALQAYWLQMESRIGLRHRVHIGPIDRRTIRRYATAIGDASPIRHDVAAARAAGFSDLVAPPNFLSAVADWGAGAPEVELAPDGIARDPATADLRVMGAGEALELMGPVTAGLDLYQDEVVERVELKQGRSGPIVFVTALHEFSDADGVVYNRNRRTVLARSGEVSER